MKLKTAVMLFGLMVGPGQVMAHIPPGGVVIDFDGDDVNGKSIPISVFPAFDEFYLEDSVVHSAIGFGTAPGDSIGNIGGKDSHIHGVISGDGTFGSELAGDAGGGLFQLQDGDAFSMLGFDISELELDANHSSMTFRGYTSADFLNWYDVTLTAGAGGVPVVTDGADTVPTDAVAAGTHVHLDDVAAFGSLYLFEYFYDNPGRGFEPNAPLKIVLDNVEIGPEVAAVPVPAAVYLFGSALFGLVGMGNRQGGKAVCA